MSYKTGYMVRNNKGEFSMGGQSPRFRISNGKIWSQLGHVKNHIRQFKDKDNRQIMVDQGWEIVKVKLVVESVSKIDEFLPDMFDPRPAFRW